MPTFALPPFHQWRVGVTVLAVAALASGCATSARINSPGVASTSATPTSHSLTTTPARTDDPATVALAYFQAVVTGNSALARTFLYSKNLRTFDLISKAATNVHGSARNLAVGAVQRRGAVADAVLTGTICEAENCLTNSSTTAADPRVVATAADPRFVVHLRQVAGHWFVWYPTPAK